MLLLSDLALRSTAIRHLMIEDVWDTATGIPKICATCKEKFGHTRVIIFDGADILPAMKKHLEKHKFMTKYPFPASETLKDSPPMSHGTLYQLGLRIAKRAGVNYAGLHRIRHWKVGNMIANGVSIEVVSQCSGHKSVITTYAAYWKPKSKEIHEQFTNQEAAFKECVQKTKPVQSLSSSGSTLAKVFG
jgi:integrase